jgi:short-subunit dehydrogenase
VQGSRGIWLDGPGYTSTEFHDVMQVDRDKIQRGLWMKADDVVAASLDGLDRGALFVLQGWQYKLLVKILLPLVPRWLFRWGALHMSRRTGRVE